MQVCIRLPVLVCRYIPLYGMQVYASIWYVYRIQVNICICYVYKYVSICLYMVCVQDLVKCMYMLCVKVCRYIPCYGMQVYASIWIMCRVQVKACIWYLYRYVHLNQQRPKQFSSFWLFAQKMVKNIENICTLGFAATEEKNFIILCNPEFDNIFRK